MQSSKVLNGRRDPSYEEITLRNPMILFLEYISYSSLNLRAALCEPYTIQVCISLREVYLEYAMNARY